MYKSTSKSFVPLVVLFFVVTGCNFISDAKTKLAHYCPGLKISISGINYSYKNGTKTYTITYAGSSQNAVDAYFENKANGFTSSDGKSFDSQGFILAKIFKEPKGTASVVYSKLTEQIIIVENGN
jgi:hypothetical protein